VRPRRVELGIADRGQTGRFEPARTDSAKQTQFGGTPAAGLPPRACAGRLYKQTQFRPVAAGLAVQTNPICPRWRGRRGRRWSQSCQTNPISPVDRRLGTWKHAKQTQFPAGGIPHHSTILLFHRSSPMPIVQTNPIWSVQQRSRWGKPHPTRGSIAPNKANSHHSVRRGKGLAGKELW